MSLSRPKHWERLARDFGVAALLALRGDEVVAQWGAVDQPYNVRSIRKSLLSALYGATQQTAASLDATLAELEIDDKDGLSACEKEARVRHLLMARSGVYHPAAYEPPSMKAKRPPRGSKRAGEYWFYNNWDFNTLGTIYERLSGEELFDSFESRIARRIGFQNFSLTCCRRVFEPVSYHPAHIFSLSARDLARFGLLFLNGGQWEDERIIPPTWIRQSTKSYSNTDVGRLGYGYLWWIAPSDSPFGPGAYFALGAGGQGLAVLPSHGLVVAQLVAVAEGAERLKTDHFARILRSIVTNSR